MSTFTRDDVQRLATLARVELTPEETALFARQLADILDFVREVQAIDTSSVATLPSPPHDGGVLREDAIRPSLDRDELLAAAPDADAAAGLFKVPRVLNG